MCVALIKKMFKLNFKRYLNKEYSLSYIMILNYYLKPSLLIANTLQFIPVLVKTTEVPDLSLTFLPFSLIKFTITDMLIIIIFLLKLSSSSGKKLREKCWKRNTK